MRDTKTFILIHGAWHGSWCWDSVINKMQESGHQVYALDLPGHYQNHVEFHDVTLASYLEYVKNFIQKIDGKVILVGHSMSGIIISQVAEDLPDKISKLIYLTAFVPDYQGSLMEEEKKSIKSTVTLEIIIYENKIQIKHSQKLKELFYSCCSEKEADFAITQLQDQPLQPFVDRVSLSDQNFGKTEKVYIECLKDRAILIEDQRRMNQKINCKKITLDSDHSPFFSCPELLVEILIKEN
jgi:pimeloyl-ACP methyl ester carboxylesterase